MSAAGVRAGAEQPLTASGSARSLAGTNRVGRSDTAILTALVDAVRDSVGDHPVLVLGSRAIGTAPAQSDLDAYVVLPLRRIPRALGALTQTRSALERELGIPVSLNPLPAGRLHRTRGSLLPFKLRREALVAWSPDGWRMDRAGAPPVDSAARRSYAMSGVLYLLDAAAPVAQGADRLAPAEAHLTGKALLHAAQLVLAGQGGWESCLQQAVTRLGGQWPELAATRGAPGTWLAVRDMLLPAVRGHRETRAESIALRLQWAGLSTLRGRATTAPTRRGPSPAAELALAACELAEAISPGHMERERIASARAALPERMRREAPNDWDALRKLVASRWPDASPLAGI